MVEAWKIGVSIAMTSNANQILGVLGRDLFKLGKQAEALTGQLNMMKVAALGAMGVVAGGAALAGMAKLVSHGQQLVHQQALFQTALKNSGLTAQQVAEQTAKVTAAAWQNTRDVLGTGVAENLANIRELRMVFGESGRDDVSAVKEAIEHLKEVTQARMVMESMLGRDSGGQVFDMAKALEIKGASMDPEHFTKLLDAMVKAAVASGGKVLGSDFFSAFKYGRTATQGWDDRFIGQILPTLIQEMKGGGGSGGGTGGPGNALQSAFQAVVGGTMTNKAAEEFFKLGLLDQQHIIFTKTGSIKGIRPGGIKGSGEFQSDPYQWVQDVLVPALQNKGITGSEAVREEVSHMFVNRTAQQIMTMFATQQVRFGKDAKLIGQAGGLDSQKDLLAHDPTMQMKAFTEAWQNLLTALGAPLVEPAYRMLGLLTNGLNSMTKWAADHPETTKIIGEVAAALAALSIGVGTIAIGTAAFAALAAIGGPVGVIALIGVAAAVTAANLDKLHNAIQNLVPALAAKPDANGKMPLDNIHDNGVQVPWWWPLPAGPGGRAPAPDLNLNHHLPGGGVRKESYVPDGSSGSPRIQTITYIQLDKRTIATAVSEEQGRALSLPSPGSSRFDPRMTPSFPSDTLRV